MVKAMVLAAGVGSRLEPISSFIPKPLVPVLNRPVMEHILRLLNAHGITDVVSNTHHMADKLEDYFNANPPSGMNLRLFKEQELSGDAGGVRAAKDFLSGSTFLVIMGDLITNADISALIQEHKEKKALATIAVKQAKDVTRFGVMKRNSDGFIQAFQEKPAAHEAISNEISTGIYILEPEIFDHIPTSGIAGFGKQIFPLLVKKGLPVLGAELKGYWSDIGTLQDLFRTNIDALYGRLPIKMLGTIKERHDLGADEQCEQEASKSSSAQACSAHITRGIQVSNSAQIASSAKIAKNVLIGEQVIISEQAIVADGSIIGDNSKIGANCQIRNSLLFAGCEIVANSKIEDSILAFGQQIKMSTVAR